MKKTHIKIVALEKQRQALELRKAGNTYEAIADELGYKNRSCAHKAVSTALRNIVAPHVEELRTLEGERLDQMHAVLWDKAMAGDTRAVNLILRIMERRTKLFGLDTQIKSDQSGEATQVEYPKNVDLRIHDVPAAIKAVNRMISEVQKSQ